MGIATLEIDMWTPRGVTSAANPTLGQSTHAIAPGLLSVKMYPGATHAWDRVTEPDVTVTDPFSHLGRGGEVDFKASPAVAAQGDGGLLPRQLRAVTAEAMA